MTTILIVLNVSLKFLSIQYCFMVSELDRMENRTTNGTTCSIAAASHKNGMILFSHPFFCESWRGQFSIVGTTNHSNH